MTNGEYIYSFNKKDWHKFDEECHDYVKASKLAEQKMRECGAVRCYVEFADKITLDDVISNCVSLDSACDCANDMICYISSSVYHNYGIYGYLDVVTDKEASELGEIIKNVTVNWLRKHNYEPNTVSLKGGRVIYCDD